jgi:hypothetical protein
VAQKGVYDPVTNNCQNFCTAARYLTEPKSIDVSENIKMYGTLALGVAGVAAGAKLILCLFSGSKKTETSDNNPETRSNEDSLRKKK